MNGHFSVLIQKLKNNCSIIIIAFALIPQVLFAAEAKKDETQKADAQTAVQKPIEIKPDSAEKKEDVKKPEAPKEQEKASAGFYFYPSSTSQNSSGNDSASPEIPDFGNGSSASSSDDGIAYVPLAPTPPKALTPDNLPDRSIPPGLDKGTTGSNLDKWLSKHPDVKERMRKQQEMMNAQIKNNQAKLARQFKNSNLPQGDTPPVSQEKESEK